MIENYTYYAFFSLSGVTDEQKGKIQQIANEFHFDLDVGDRYFELEYDGRDTVRRVLRMFVEFAKVLHHGDGELMCQVHEDSSSDPLYEFYTIENGELLLQRGRVVREDTREKVQLPELADDSR